MNPPRPARTIALLVLLLATSLPSFAKENILINFADSRKDPDGTVFRVYEYTFQDWGSGKVQDIRGRGALVRAVSGKGGLGENKTMVRFDKVPMVELVYILGSSNRASSINFSLTDKDGTEHQWSVPFTGMAPGPEYRHRIELANPSSEVKPGKTPGLDLKKIATWQVRGDYQDAAVEVMLLKVVAAN